MGIGVVVGMRPWPEHVPGGRLGHGRVARRSAPGGAHGDEPAGAARQSIPSRGPADRRRVRARVLRIVPVRAGADRRSRPPGARAPRRRARLVATGSTRPGDGRRRGRGWCRPPRARRRVAPRAVARVRALEPAGSPCRCVVAAGSTSLGAVAGVSGRLVRRACGPGAVGALAWRSIVVRFRTPRTALEAFTGAGVGLAAVLVPTLTRDTVGSGAVLVGGAVQLAVLFMSGNSFGSDGPPLVTTNCWPGFEPASWWRRRLDHRDRRLTAGAGRSARRRIAHRRVALPGRRAGRRRRRTARRHRCGTRAVGVGPDRRCPRATTRSPGASRGKGILAARLLVLVLVGLGVRDRAGRARPDLGDRRVATPRSSRCSACVTFGGRLVRGAARDPDRDQPDPWPRARVRRRRSPPPADDTRTRARRRRGAPATLTGRGIQRSPSSSPCSVIVGRGCRCAVVRKRRAAAAGAARQTPIVPRSTIAPPAPMTGPRDRARPGHRSLRPQHAREARGRATVDRRPARARRHRPDPATRARPGRTAPRATPSRPTSSTSPTFGLSDHARAIIGAR